MISLTMAMARSPAPYIGNCIASKAKPYKRLASRIFRRRERADILAGREPNGSLKITRDPRLMAYDDKRYRLGGAAREMRK